MKKEELLIKAALDAASRIQSNPNKSYYVVQQAFYIKKCLKEIEGGFLNDRSSSN